MNITRTITISTTKNLPPSQVARQVRYEAPSANCDIIPGVSLVKGEVENRAEIRLYNVTHAMAMWIFSGLKEAYDLTCAWYDDGAYAGCILKHPEYSDPMSEEWED